MKDHRNWYRHGTKDHPGECRTTRVFIDDRHVEDAKALARTKPAQPRFWADTEERGLILRVRGDHATWIVKRKGHTKTVGQAARMLPKTARERARAGKALIDAGIDPAPYFAGRTAGLTEAQAREAAVTKAIAAAPREPRGWTWEELVRRYKDEHIARGREAKGRRKPASSSTADDVAKAFAAPELSALSNRFIATISRSEIEAIGEAIRKRSQWAHRKFILYTRAAFRWADRRAGLSGLDQVDGPWWLRLAIPPIDTPPRDERHLTPEQLGWVLAIAEAYRRLPGRRLDRETSETALSALWWLALTSQRRGAGLAVKKNWVVPDAKKPGWSIVAFPPEVMKSRKSHTLPLPPAVTALVARARTADKRGSAWLFPSERSVGAGKDPKASDSIVTLLIRRLRGGDQIGRKGRLGDLLKGIPPFSPHDLRDSLATGLKDLTIRGDAISAVLDHESLESDKRFSESEAAITKLAYDHSQQIELKRLAIEPWVNLVVGAYETALCKLLQSLPNAAELDPWRPAT